MNYPKGIKQISENNYIRYDNRGMDLENDINITNQYYIDKEIAYIYKKPTPIQVTKVDYKNGMIIKEAYFKEPSTTDYNGLYNGLYIDFEAKETISKTSFPLANIHKHQILHIKHIVDNNGIAFLIVRFKTLNKDFLLLGEDFINYLKDNTRKSIPLSYFEEKGYLINPSYMPRIDYLKIIDNLQGGKYGKEKEKRN
ncbi:MAG: recombination protein U [Bacilli bacterium]|nr:recombination protein U [Bacilli bacterium]